MWQNSFSFLALCDQENGIVQIPGDTFFMKIFK